MILLIFRHLDFVCRFNKRNLLLALGSFKVIHHLREAHKLSLHVLTLLDLFLDSIFHETALVELLALFELDLETLLSLVALLSLGEECERFLLLLLLHLLTDAGCLARATLLFETLRFVLLMQLLRSGACLLDLALLLLENTLLLFLATLNDNLARKSKLVLVLHLSQKFRNVDLR